MSLIPAPPDTFALIARDEHSDMILQGWVIETVVAFDADDGGAYVVGGKNMSGRLVRLDVLSERNGFKLAALREQTSGGRDAAHDWAGRHIKVRYESAFPELDDPRYESGD